jgi:hypothetical protein
MKVWVAISSKIQTSKFIREITFGLAPSENTTHIGVTAAWIRLELSLNDAVDVCPPYDHAMAEHPHIGIMWVIFDHLRPSGHIMLIM